METQEQLERFARWMNAKLKANQMTAAEFSRASGISKGRVSDYLHAQGLPSKRNAQRIADVFGVSAATVLVVAGDIDSEDPLDPHGDRQQLLDLVKRVNLDDPGRSRVLRLLLEDMVKDSEELDHP